MGHSEQASPPPESIKNHIRSHFSVLGFETVLGFFLILPAVLTAGFVLERKGGSTHRPSPAPTPEERRTRKSGTQCLCKELLATAATTATGQRSLVYRLAGLYPSKKL